MSDGSAYDEEMQGTRLGQLRIAAGFPSMAAFARAAGIDPNAASKHVQRESVPQDVAVLYIEAAKHTGADIQWLLFGRGHAPTHVSVSEQNHIRVNTTKVVARTIDAAALPSVRLWTIAQRRKSTGGVVLEESEDSVSPMGELRNSKSAFAVQVWDDVNAPWLRRGAVIFVDPVRLPADGQWCMLASDQSGDGPTLHNPAVGVLKEVKDGSWMLHVGAALVPFAVADWPLAFLVTYIRQI